MSELPESAPLDDYASNDIDCFPTKIFNNCNIKFYGNVDNPMFKVKDIANILGVKHEIGLIRNIDQDDYNGDMVTEKGMHEILCMSNKPMAKRLQIWIITEMKKARQRKSLQLQKRLETTELVYKIQLENKNKELNAYKEKSYEEVEKNEHVYLIGLDGGKKIGRCANKDLMTRLKGFQTGNINDVEVIYDHWTSDSFVLERLVHGVLKKYRCRKNREFFDCDNDFMINVIKICGQFMDTMMSMCSTMSANDILFKLKEKGINMDKPPAEDMQVNDSKTDETASILCQNYEKGDKNDYVKMDDIKKVMKDNNIEVIDGAKIKMFAESLFHCVYEDEAWIYGRKHEKVFVGLKPNWSLLEQQEVRVCRKPLYKFLQENTKYKEGNMVFMEDINKSFSVWLGKKVHRLDNGTFAQVNKQYIVEIKKVCKHCKKEALKGCCDKYNHKNRTRKCTVQNIVLLS